MVELLEGWLRHKSDMVNLEAARAICEIKNVSPAQLTRPIAGESQRVRFSNLSHHAPSTSTFPVIAQTCSQVRCYTDTGYPCPFTPKQCCYLQCRS